MRRVLLLAVALATAVTYTVPAGAAGPGDRGGPPAPDSGPGHDYVMVTLSSPPTASYTGGIGDLKSTKPATGKLDMGSTAFAAYQDHLSAERAAFIDDLRRNAPNAEVVRSYSLVLNGVALKLNGHSLAEVSRASGISNIGFSSLYKPDMNVSVELIGADDVWDGLGGQESAGSGISVGIIDTGIDDTHPFFACKDADDDGHADIEHEVFVSGEGTELFGEDLFFDHGTHVAGTVAGCVIPTSEAPPVELVLSDFISGVAPGATLHDYNVFPGFGAGFIAFGGSAFSHDIAAALEEAVNDDMDVVNMSLGGGVEGPHDFLAEASNATVDAGTVVVTSAGNSGPGDATVGSPAVAEKVIAVAASTNGHFGGVPVDVGSTQYIAAAGDFGPYGDSTSAEMVRWNDGEPTEDDLACGDAPDKEVSGKIALISRGACSFTTKIRTAQDHEAVGVVVYNNIPEAGAFGMGHDGTDPKPTIVGVMVSLEDGVDIIDKQLTGDPASAAASIAGSAKEFTTEADRIANFSSRGPAPFTYIIKPDITAPGVNVYSSVFNNEFAFFQGTSMSSPHIAGAAALLLHDDDTRDPIDVKSALVNTANRERFIHDGEGIELLARGGGIAWLPDAIESPATLDPVNASFGLWEGNKAVRDSIEITISDESCTATGVTHDGGDPVGTIVTMSQDGDTVTVTLDAGKAGTTGSGDYAGDILFQCDTDPEPDLLAPWFVRIDRKAAP